MLHWRILTALCLIPLVLVGVLKLSSLSFAIVSGVFFGIGAWEWAGLCHYRLLWKKSLYVIIFLLSLLAVSFINSDTILCASFLWAFPLYWVCTYKNVTPSLLKSKFIKAAIGIGCLALSWYALNSIHHLQGGPYWIILLFLLVWATDTFAYFGGKKWGKAFLIPFVSPNKTKVGFCAGVLGAFCVAIIAYVVMQNAYFNSVRPILLTPPNLSLWLSIAYITILLSVVGDLFESLLKRIADIKDSGKLFPGHGGVLDRIDSLLSTLPFYALSLTWFQH